MPEPKIAKDSAGSLTSLPPTYKDKESEAACSSSETQLPRASKTKGAFKAVVNVLIAMQRFKHALNPTITFGKREADIAPQIVFNPLVSAPGRTASGPAPGARTASRTITGTQRTASGRPMASGIHYGHKSHILLRALPEVQPVMQ